MTASISQEAQTVSRALTAVEFQRQTFGEILDFFRLVRIGESTGSDFVKREPTELLKFRTIPELLAEANAELSSIVTQFEHLSDTLGKPMRELLTRIDGHATDALLLLRDYHEFSEIKSGYLHEAPDSVGEIFQMKADSRKVYIESRSGFADDAGLLNSYGDDRANRRFLYSVMRACKEARDAGRNHSAEESGSIWFAYSMLDGGVTLDSAFVPIGTSGFRQQAQTLIFSTDPGDDHIRVTAARKDLIAGVAVHVEHIDRDQVTDKERVEAYRMPAPLNAVHVRLHIGDSAPVTAFIGRPVFENGWQDIHQDGHISHDNFMLDKLKSVHYLAGACNSMFLNGVADCKVAVERMSRSDAVEFMKCVVGNVLRDRTRQTLAAAFNINTPFFDDTTGKQVTDRLAIAQLAIEIASAGGFDRVTWDGADSKHVPSIPVIDQMPHEDFVELVHAAHEKGLQTYFSAGLEAQHVARCVITGVDGLGIGTSLHYQDPQTKLMGAFNPELIKKVLDARTQAEATVLGRGAKLMARFDRLFFEKALTTAEDQLRGRLLDGLKRQDEAVVTAVLGAPEAKRVLDLPDGGEHPLVDRGVRFIEFYETSQDQESSQARRQYYQEIKEAVRELDLPRLESLFLNS